jgi:Rubredoxin metal binding domain
MSKVRTVLSCRECGQQLARWAGRCPGCGAWGTIEEGGFRSSSSARPVETLAHEEADERRVSTGMPGIDRVLGGGLVPSTVALLAGEPGISKVYLGARRHEHGGRLASRGIQSVASAQRAAWAATSRLSIALMYGRVTGLTRPASARPPASPTIRR